MTVNVFGRVADRVGRNRFHPLVILLLAALRRQDGPEAQLLKEGRPQRVVFIHIEDPGQANRPVFGQFTAERAVLKELLVLALDQVDLAVIPRVLPVQA